MEQHFTESKWMQSQINETPFTSAAQS